MARHRNTLRIGEANHTLNAAVRSGLKKNSLLVPSSTKVIPNLSEKMQQCKKLTLCDAWWFKLFNLTLLHLVKTNQEKHRKTIKRLHCVPLAIMV